MNLKKADETAEYAKHAEGKRLVWSSRISRLPSRILGCGPAVLRNRQFLFYCAIGVCGATLDFAIYSAVLLAGSPRHQVANALGYSAGTLLSFVANAWLNFKTRDRLARRFLCFASIALLGWATSAATLEVLVDRLNVNRFLSKLLTIVVVVVLQYNLNRIISFRKTSSLAHG